MPTFFQDHACTIRFPEATDIHDGLRRAQLGAIFAIGSHFSLSREPSLVSMPTGTGKTAVLMMAPLLLKAHRALVITPSRMVRDQIVEEFESLSLLKRLGVVPNDGPTPVVLGIESKILREEQWDALQAADVVVTTPMGSSPALDAVPHPPQDLFDLLLVDEAHHSPAHTWKALMSAFPNSKQVLFTATPFRRDRKLLPGRFVYEFPLREALRDGVFGSIRFIGCDPEPPTHNDAIIARRAELEFRSDRDAGLDHRLMVRTDSRTRAAELKAVYEQSTQLRLAVIHGQHSLRYVRRTVQQLRAGDLDGVICVDMFGEGVDMPQLKIAAIHAPHRSLAVTLQFIGRFARTGRSNLGDAKFIAIPEEIETETKTLYRQGAVWEQLVTNLADSRIAGERQLHEQLRSFSLDDSISDEGITLAVIKPWYHCKVFHAGGAVDLHRPLDFGRTVVILQHFVSDDLHCAVYVCQVARKPRWLEVASVQDVEYLLFIIHFDEAHRLLFINSSIKNEDVYAQIAEQLIEGSVFRGVSTSHINRALRALQQPSFFSVGLKNRLLGSQVESYRIISGGKADGAVSNTDAQLFDRGHLFGSGEGNEGKVTLGISTLSKVWSNRAGFVPEFVSWCGAIAEHLSNSEPVVTGSRIDLLAIGEEVTTIPSPVIAASWHETAYKTHPLVYIADTTIGERDLLSLDLEITSTSLMGAQMTLVGMDCPVAVDFSIDTDNRYRVTCSAGEVRVRFRAQDGPLERYLNSFGLHLYLADFSRLYGNQHFRSNMVAAPLSQDAINKRNWTALGVDITCEFGTSAGGLSIHDAVGNIVSGTPAAIVVYDHRPGEIADYVVLDDQQGRIRCEVYHCKKSGGPSPSYRVDDAYEVVGQIIKCLAWSKSASALKTQLTRRLASGSILRKGTLVELERILDHAESAGFEFHVRLVQPGLSHSGMSVDVARILAAGHEYVRLNTGIAPETWISE